jgi:hypothetical protein
MCKKYKNAKILKSAGGFVLMLLTVFSSDCHCDPSPLNMSILPQIDELT